MKAVVFEALNTVSTKEIAQPKPGAGEALVQVKSSGICHTDIEILEGRYGSGAFPLVPGHEYAGVVVDVGPDVSALAPGDRVVVDPNIHCGKCRACKAGRTNLCESLGAYGVTINGGFAEYSTVGQENLVKIGDMPFSQAALAEPVGCILNGIDSIGTPGVANALVFGAGPIGMLMALALRTRGVRELMMVDVQDSRLEFATSFGLKPLKAGSGELEALHHAVDLVVDATGVTKVTASLVGYCANGGKVLFFGVCPPDARIEIAPFELFRRQITMAGTHSLNHNIRQALKVIGDIGPEIVRLVSHEVALDEIPNFMRSAGSLPTLKVQAVSER